MASVSNNKYKSLLKKGLPAFLIPGIIFTTIYGVDKIKNIKNYYSDKEIFPRQTMVESVEDGDTFKLVGGQTVRMLGIDAPNRGQEGEAEAKNELQKLIENKKMWLEYDRYQDDKYGRILAWVWVDCESNVVIFKSADYMHLSGNESRDYIRENPDGCKNGLLVNKIMVEKNQAKPIEYAKRGRLKYEIK